LFFLLFSCRRAFIFVAFRSILKKLVVHWAHMHIHTQAYGICTCYFAVQSKSSQKHTHTQTHACTHTHRHARQAERSGRADMRMRIRMRMRSCEDAKMRMCGEQGLERSTSSNDAGDTDCRFVVSPTKLCGDCDAGSDAGCERRATNAATHGHTHAHGAVVGDNFALALALALALAVALSLFPGPRAPGKSVRERALLELAFASSHCRRWVIRRSLREREREVRPPGRPSHSLGRQSSARSRAATAALTLSIRLSSEERASSAAIAGPLAHCRLSGRETVSLG